MPDTQNLPFSGQVRNTANAALSGVDVTLWKGSNKIAYSSTDTSGRYSFLAPAGIYTVEFSSRGFQTLLVVNTLVDGSAQLNVALRLSGKNIQESETLTYQKAHRQFIGQTLIATPGNQVDTVVIFDPETMEPTVHLEIRRPTEPVSPPTGIFPRTDTIVTFDPETYEERVVIKSYDEKGLEVDDLNPFRGNIIKTDKLDLKKPPSAAEPGKTLTSDEIRHLPTRNVSATNITAKGSTDAKTKALPKRAMEKKSPASGKPKMVVKESNVAESRKKSLGEVSEITTSAPDFDAPTPAAGVLTAGEWNDLHNWNKHWVDLLADGEIDGYQEMYKFFPKNRYTVMLANENDFPLIDALVILRSSKEEVVWQSRTDNTGKAELWANLYEKSEGNNYTLEVELHGRSQKLGTAEKGKIQTFRLNESCQAPNAVDIVWVVDATGSMSDEINYLKTELYDVIQRAKRNNPGVALRMGSVFYRDLTDEYLVRSSVLTPDIGSTVNFIKKQSAGGGGDFPEAVHSALEDAIYRQPWNTQAIARICFLVLDASAHQQPEVIESLQKSIAEAAKRGIRVVPIACSGIQKDTEFMLKFFSVATNGTYVFLTDHSGVGGKHLEPTSDEYKVEAFNNLLVRLITDYTTVKTCEGKTVLRSEEIPADSTNQQPVIPAWQVTYYPNPANQEVNLELPEGIQRVSIYDAEGKNLQTLENPQPGLQRLPTGNWPEGFYTMRFLKSGRWQSAKLLVTH